MLVTALTTLIAFHLYLETDSYWGPSTVVKWRLFQSLAAPLIYLVALLQAKRERQSEFRVRY